MPKRIPGKSTTESVAMRICIERIVPDEVHPLHAADRTARETLFRMGEANAVHSLSAEEKGALKRMAIINSKKWPNGTQLRCRFLDGSTKQRKRVEEKAHGWEQYANIKLKFVPSGSSEIRISFGADSRSWSAVGTDALIEQYFPKHQPTMNYGWLKDDTGEDEYSRVVLHEFGHALGCIHEHQAPKFSREWNKEKVLQAFSGPPNYWSQEQIERNVLRKYSPSGITSTQFDPQSIMLYHFDGDLFSDGKGPTNENTALSTLDIQMIGQLYPKD